jgi:hypothetical protein
MGVDASCQVEYSINRSLNRCLELDEGHSDSEREMGAWIQTIRRVAGEPAR